MLAAECCMGTKKMSMARLSDAKEGRNHKRRNAVVSNLYVVVRVFKKNRLYGGENKIVSR